MKELTKEDAIETLKTVMDPELNIDVWTMGLIYEVKLKEGNNIEITMTLTNPMCPLASVIEGNVKSSLEEKGFKDVNIEMTFDPPWEPSEELKKMLGLS